MNENGDTSERDKAQLEILEALEVMFCHSDNAVVSVGQKLERAIDKLLDISDKHLQKLVKKISKYIDRVQVAAANVLEYLFTRIRIITDADLDRVEWLLTQLATKSGMIQIGQEIHIILTQEKTCEPEVKWGGMLVLSVKEAIPYMEQLIEVLKEIRNRLPAVIQEETVELKATEIEPDYPWAPPSKGYSSEPIKRVI